MSWRLLGPPVEIRNGTLQHASRLLHMPQQQSHLRHTVKHCGWWPRLHCSWPRRCRHLRVTALACRLLRSGRRGSPPAELWAAIHLPLPSPEAGRFAATRWSPWGCRPPGRRAWRDSRLSPPRQRGGGRCEAASPLCEPWNLRRVWRFLETAKSIQVYI